MDACLYYCLYCALKFTNCNKFRIFGYFFISENIWNILTSYITYQHTSTMTGVIKINAGVLIMSRHVPHMLHHTDTKLCTSLLPSCICIFLYILFCSHSGLAPWQQCSPEEGEPTLVSSPVGQLIPSLQLKAYTWCFPTSCPSSFHLVTQLSWYAVQELLLLEE